MNWLLEMETSMKPWKPEINAQRAHRSLVEIRRHLQSAEGMGATIREARMLCTCVCPQSLCSLTLDIQSVSHNLGLTVRPRVWFDENFVAERSSQAQESPLTLSDAQRPLKGDETRSMRTSAVLFFLETMPIHKLR
jgi:hypothetical protein